MEAIDGPPATTRPGRRPGPSRTREAILDAARRRFAAVGYDRATIRAIARDAGVDPALVMHFFGSKQRVLAEAMRLPFDVEELAARVADGGAEGLGERLARFFLAVWDDPSRGPAMVAMLRSAASHDEAAARLRELVCDQILPPISAAVRGRGGELRGDLVSAQLVGVAFLRYVVRVEPLASADADVLARMLGPSLQGCMA